MSGSRFLERWLRLKKAADKVSTAEIQPDIFERPGVQVDFVARQGVPLFGKELELKFEARNIFGNKYKEMQQNGDNVIYYNLYRTGTTFSLGGSLKF